MSHFNEHAMRAKIDDCLKTVAVVLDANKAASVGAPDRIAHHYDDKYLLANHLTNVGIASVLNGLELLGLSRSGLGSLKQWNSHRAVSLMFKRTQKCKFVKETEREEEEPTRTQVDSTMFGRTTVKVITKIKEYYYLIEEEYALTAHSGVGDNPAEALNIASGSSRIEAVLRVNTAPFSESSVETCDVNISWLLKHLNEAATTSNFTIDRSAKDCATPRRNPDVAAAMRFFSLFSSFCNSVHYQLHQLSQIQSSYQPHTAAKVDMTGISTEGVFNPIVPLFENHEDSPVVNPTAIAGIDGAAQAVVSAERGVSLPDPVVNKLVDEQCRSLAAKCAQVAGMFVVTPSPATGRVFGAAEATLMTVLVHLAQFGQYYQDAVNYIEHMIRSQLVAAIGKELTARDFAQYMTFHNRKVFKEAFQPKPFSYAVRRSPLHSPEGQIQIETSETTPAEPIYTVSQHTENAPLMEFALNATTTVKFGGERHLHGWMAHRFSGQALPDLKFVAEARQFSSYIVLIGRIASAKLFQPKYGFIVQNKDEFRIPLDLEQIPTAKEFKDAISSLSPEQQRFAKAFRSMQLESTLFGVCVIQIKPQLEKVLKLQADSLTKEIKLTQDLMQLFIKYQIPSDLLSYDPSSADSEYEFPEGQCAAERLLMVKRHVQAMQEMLAIAKDEEVAAAAQLREFQYGQVRDVQEIMRNNIDSVLSRGDKLESLDDGNIVEKSFSGHKMRKGGGMGVMSMLGGSARRSEAAPAPQREEMMDMKRSRSPAPQMKMASASGSLAPTAHTVTSTSTASKPASAPATTAAAPAQQGTTEHAEAAPEATQVDYTQYPNKLEEMYTRFDPDASLRPTIINPGATWAKRAQAGLLSTPLTSSLDADLQTKEKNAAFDLLDALTRSGALPIEHASLHVIIAATHCFDQSLMDTVVQKNVNPIERVERSTLIMAATLNNLPASALITEGQVQRVATFSPALFDEQPNAAIEA